MSDPCSPREKYRRMKRLEKANRHYRRCVRINQLKRKLFLPFRFLMRPKEIIWLEDFGGMYPACPRCYEYVYYSDQCCFCGQRLKNNDQTVGGVSDGWE